MRFDYLDCENILLKLFRLLPLPTTKTVFEGIPKLKIKRFFCLYFISSKLLFFFCVVWETESIKVLQRYIKELECAVRPWYKLKWFNVLICYTLLTWGSINQTLNIHVQVLKQLVNCSDKPTKMVCRFLVRTLDAVKIDFSHEIERQN